MQFLKLPSGLVHVKELLKNTPNQAIVMTLRAICAVETKRAAAQHLSSSCKSGCKKKGQVL